MSGRRNGRGRGGGGRSWGKCWKKIKRDPRRHMAMEEEQGPGGEMSSRRSSQGPSQASQERSIGSFASGDSSSTLQPVSGNQPVSQASSLKFSQSQDNSQQMSQPSSMDVRSQLRALAAAARQVC